MGGKEKANSFITSFENYKKYILFPTDSSKYACEENGYNIVNGNGFLKGRFISATEYRMSIHDDSSWLSLGIGYWTLTKGSNNEYYYISNSIFTKDMNEKISVRITEFIHPSVTVKGTGTITKCNTGVKQYSGGGCCGCCYTPSAGGGACSGGAGQANTGGGGGAYYLNARSGGSGIVIFRDKI